MGRPSSGVSNRSQCLWRGTIYGEEDRCVWMNQGRRQHRCDQEQWVPAGRDPGVEGMRIPRPTCHQIQVIEYFQDSRTMITEDHPGTYEGEEDGSRVPRAVEPPKFQRGPLGALQITIFSLPGEAGLVVGQWILKQSNAGPTGPGGPWAHWRR